MANDEKLRLTVFDSDRFSADDELGIVEVSLADLISVSRISDHQPPTGGLGLQFRSDALRRGRARDSATKGKLNWSVAYFPIWQVPMEAESAPSTFTEADNIESTVGASLVEKIIKSLLPEDTIEQQQRVADRAKSVGWYVLIALFLILCY